MAILGLGLSTTETDANWRFTNIRRRVFYQYPGGAAPLTGILSLLPTEDTNDPKYSWWEKRFVEQKSITLTVGSSKGPFGGNAATTNTWGSTPRTDGTGVDAGTVAVAGDRISIKVADTTPFRIGHIIEINGLIQYTNGNASRPTFRVAGFNATSDATSNTNPLAAGYLDCFVNTVGGATTGWVNSNTNNNGMPVLVVGSAFGQGAVVTSQQILTLTGQMVSQPTWNAPVNLENYTQIFRSPFSFAGTVLKTAVKWDDTGPYKDRAKETSLYHMVEIEKAMLFGQKSLLAAGVQTAGGGTAATAYSGTAAGLPTYTMGGIIWFLLQWELGTVYGNSASAITANTDDGKRIITSVGALSDKVYNGYLERLFRYTSNTSNEKLVLCGSGFLSVINQLYKSQSCLNADLPLSDTFGMKVVAHTTPFGTIYYKTHPLFNQNSSLRNNALYLDTGNLKYRYMQGRDTDLLKNRQPNNADFREDEWLTECGFDCKYPETHMYMTGVTDYIP